MSIARIMRAYHAALTLGVCAAYFTGEFEDIHVWLGYAVAAVLAFRFVWGGRHLRVLGPRRFIPAWDEWRALSGPADPPLHKALVLGLMLCILTATGTGLVMAHPEIIGFTQNVITPSAHAQDAAKPRVRRPRSYWDQFTPRRVHQLASTGILGFAGLHIAYVLLYRRRQSRFMSFFPE